MDLLNLDPHILLQLGRFLGAGLALGLGGIGAAIGMGVAAGHATTAMMRQPSTQGALLRTMLIGQAVGGSASIFALVIGLLILFLAPPEVSEVGWTWVAMLTGAGISIGLGGFGVGLGCGDPAGAACEGVARNPERTGPITQGMIVGQAVAQSPAIFATVVSLIMLFLFWTPGTNLTLIGVALGSGIAVGASALGSGWGSGITAGGGVDGLSRWPKSQTTVVRMMLIGQAGSQTAAVFGLLVAFIMLFVVSSDMKPNIMNLARMLGAGIAVGFGGVGPGLGCGIVPASACRATARNPRLDPLIMRTMLIGQAVAQSTAIYALIIGLVMLYVV